MAVNVVNPQDLTGRRKAELAAQAAEQQKQAAAKMSMVTAEADKRLTETVDLSEGDTVIPGEDGAQDVVVKEVTKKMRVNTTLENVTIGHGTDYTFEVGTSYKVPERIYNYLDAKGFVWH